jgi:ABC-type phosphate transport system auxiliary subunit
MFSLIFGILTVFNFHNHELVDSSGDEVKVKEAVEAWCNKKLHEWEGKKFEKFHAYYTEEFEMENIKVNMYTNQLENLERKKKMGKYTKSDDDFKAEKKSIEEKIAKTKEDLQSFKPRATYYEIYMWSNVKTKQGKPIFMELYFKLNDDYEVISHKINSSIGGESDPSKNQIMYK